MSGSKRALIIGAGIAGPATAPDGEPWWFVNVPTRPEPDPAALRAMSSISWRARFRDLYLGDAGPALDVIDATPDFPPVTTIHTMPRLKTWHRGPMVIAGKAAGPIGRVLRDAMLPAILKRAVDSKSNARTVGHRIDWEARVTPAASS